jgi:hypothetical protein
MKKVLAMAALVGVAGAATVANAAPDAATLVSVFSYSPNGAAVWNGTQDTSTWTFDTATATAAMTGGSYSRLTKAGATPLMRHTMTGVSLGNFAPTGTTWACIEGQFGGGGGNTGGVGASICGNYNFGTDLTNQSTYTAIATAGTVSFGGDDLAIGPPQSLTTSYSSMSPNFLGSNRYCLSNSNATVAADRCTVAGTTATTGYDFLFQIGDATAPTVPTSLAVTPVSSSQINLSWTASTDAVGVTGYEIERCAGATCTSYALVTTVATNSYSNIGLTASTVYRYRVRARDAAGNLSGYSTVVNGTT